MKDDDGLRQRATKNPQHTSEEPTTTPATTERDDPSSMVGHRRGPVLAYSRGGSIASSRQGLSNYKNKIIIALGATILYTAFLYRSGGARSFLGSMSKIVSTRELTVTTWNVAAINNNVFEYWLSVPEEKDYEKLMVDVENFIENPGEKDVKVSDVFTYSMFEKLDKRLVQVGWKSMQTYWEEDFRDRKIVTGFLKDKSLGSKRLASMPDRYTNLINTSDGKTVFRPTIISMYEGDLGSQDKWWAAWEKFMFDTTLKINGDTKEVWSMLKPISKAKYKEITEQEEKDSLPLSTMCAAIFDAILVHMMNTVSTPEVWQPLKRKIVDSLSRKKVDNTLKILEKQYMDSDIITLQEVSLAMIEQARKMDKLGDDYVIAAPKELDSVRDQNSVIFLKKTTFPHGSLGEITEEVEAAFPPDQDVPIARGDINAIKTADVEGVPYVIVSFHGDTNGLATKPVLDAVMAAMKKNPKLRNHRLIFGLDANTYEKGSDKLQDVTEWASHYTSYGLTSCWGDTPDPKNYTTYNARTFLQPQLNKACRKDQACEKADINPKDFILFPKTDYRVVKTWKDNTGHKEYVEGMAFPTLTFPSDHGILATTIAPVAQS